MGRHIGTAMVLSLAVASLLGNAAQASVDLSIAPLTQSVAPGGTFSVDVDISGAADLYGYQFDLSFDPKVISAVSSSEGSFLAAGGSTFFIPGTSDNVGGVVAATADTLLSPVAGATGSGTLAVFKFEALGAGISSIGISGAQLLDSDFNSIDSQSISGSVTVAPRVASAPELDPASTASGLSLLLGSLAVMRGRRRRGSTRPYCWLSPASQWRAAASCTRRPRRGFAVEARADAVLLRQLGFYIGTGHLLVAGAACARVHHRQGLIQTDQRLAFRDRQRRVRHERRESAVDLCGSNDGRRRRRPGGQLGRTRRIGARDERQRAEKHLIAHTSLRWWYLKSMRKPAEKRLNNRQVNS
jgi:hypothetical protein